MANVDFVEGTSTIEGFFNFMRERHKIWINRFIYKKPKPWTEDKILQEYKFTNVFRQLDKGTIALTEMLKKLPTDRSSYFKEYPGSTVTEEKWASDEWQREFVVWKDKLMICNIAWYRLFNLAVHAESGPYYHFDNFNYHILEMKRFNKQIFTGAHLLRGMEGEDKHDTYLRSAKEFWDDAQVILDACKTNSMQTVYDTLLQFEMVGGFIAYEMVCDLRFTHLLDKATDINTWANIGPGADRGMRRLGLPSTINTMRILYHLAEGGHAYQKLNKGDLPCDEVTYKLVYDAMGKRENLFSEGKNIWNYTTDMHPRYDTLTNKLILATPFELREIEHSLCEFDKYERVRLGQGRPRSRYNGTE